MVKYLLNNNKLKICFHQVYFFKNNHHNFIMIINIIIMIINIIIMIINIIMIIMITNIIIIMIMITNIINKYIHLNLKWVNTPLH